MKRTPKSSFPSTRAAVHTGDAMYTSATQALLSPAFGVQAVISFILNGLLNGVIAWSTFSGAGQRKDPAAYPGIPVWRWSPAINSCGVMDVLMTTFFMGFFTVLLGTSGIRQNVRKGKDQMLASVALSAGLLRLTPLAVQNLWARSAAVGLAVAGGVGLPTLLLIWASVGDGEVPGLSWVVFKSIWPAFVALPIIAATYLPAIDERCFYGLPRDADGTPAAGTSSGSGRGELEERLVMLDASVNGPGVSSSS